MKYEAYSNIEVKGDFDIFNFVSSGKHGDVLKRVIFTRTAEAHIYSLALGDVDGANGMNDWTITDNGDRDKVLATVASIILQYSQRYPERWIILAGNSNERNRLYRMAFGLNNEQLSKLYEIWGFAGEGWKPFERDITFDGYLIRRKQIENTNMKQVIKYKHELTGQEINFTVNESLQQYKGRDWASEKLERANEMLRKSKATLPR